MVDEVDVSSKNVEKEIETALKNIDTTIPKNKTGKTQTILWERGAPKE